MGGIPGWGTVAGVVARIVDTLWPSKKEALFDELKKLEVQYQDALNKGNDTEAATIRKRMAELRRKAGFTNAE